jgi:hypothetical protein
MAHVANTDDDGRPGGAGLDHVAAGATDFGIHIFRMNISFHKRPHKITCGGVNTRAKFDILSPPIYDLRFAIDEFTGVKKA